MKKHLLTILICVTLPIYSHKKSKKIYGKKREKTMMFNENIFEFTKNNSYYRKSLIAGPHSELVVMSVPVGEEIGMEKHTVDQTIVFVQGKGKAIINDVSSDVFPHHLIFIPAGTQHNVKNMGSEPLKLFTIYAPAEHEPDVIEKKKK